VKNILFGFLLLFYFCGSQAQGVISSISFEGNKTTKASYLLYFIKSEVGGMLDSTLLETDRQQLANLEVLSDAQYKVKKGADGYEITFQCQELFTLLPILNFGRIDENFWILAGATHVNLLGKGHKVYAYYQHYDRSSYAFNISLDRLKGSPWGVNLNLVKWGTLEPLYFDGKQVDYNYNNHTYGVEGVYRFDFFNKVLLGASYFNEYYKAVSPLVEGAPARANKDKILIKSLYECNRVNHFFFYQSGFSNTLNFQTVFSLDGDPTFHIAFNDFKYFERIGKKGNLATRVRVGLSSNQASPFAPFVLDSYLNIRGVGNRVDRGTGVIVGNVEYRHSFIDRNKIAVQGVAFSDLGTWRNPGGGLENFVDEDNMVWFGGIGARIIHKKIYNAILRIDYGFNFQNLGGNGLVFGVGQYF
jgi:outer membrane protein insertion porin family